MKGPCKDAASQLSFNIREMTLFLDGNENITLQKEILMSELSSDPLFDDFLQEKRLLSFSALRSLTLRRVKKLQEGLVSDGFELDSIRKKLRIELYGLADFDVFIRYLVHKSLFGGAVYGQGTDEQRQHWLPQMESMAIYGCFGMTELGHGSFLRGLETTATLDQNTDEFVIHSPTVTSTKWWIGGAAESATHCAVFAKMFVHSQDYGVHTFIVPLRDATTFEIQPGISIGDCGVKMGGNGIDNGWIQFNKVRVPRANLLSRFASLSREGIYSPAPSPQIAYGALIGGRHTLIKYTVGCLKKALIIAIRYSNKRTQGLLGSKKDEVTLMNYGYHQERLLVRLAWAYAWHFQLPSLESHMTRLQEGLAAQDLTHLAEVHALTAGMKAFGTWDTHRAIDECRQACGGHGYSEMNGLAALQRDFAVMCTWEGDNAVMAQQTARYLVNCFNSLGQQHAKDKLPASLKYLSFSCRVMQAKVRKEDLWNPVFQWSALASLARFKVKTAAENLKTEQLAHPQLDSSEVWSRLQVPLVSCAKSHIQFILYRSFQASIEDSPLALKPSLMKLLTLFTMSVMRENFSAMLEADILSKESIKTIQEEIMILCREIAGMSDELVEAFNMCDRILGSCIGGTFSNADAKGTLYHTYFNQAKKIHNGNMQSCSPDSEIMDILSKGQDIYELFGHPKCKL